MQASHTELECHEHTICGLSMGFGGIRGTRLVGANTTAAGVCLPCPAGAYQMHAHHRNTSCSVHPPCAPGQSLTHDYLDLVHAPHCMFCMCYIRIDLVMT